MTRTVPSSAGAGQGSARPRIPGQAGRRSAHRQGRRLLGEVLLSHGLLTEEQLEAALDAQADPRLGKRRRLGAVLIDQGLVDERRLAAAIGEALGLDLVDVGHTTIDLPTARLLPRSVCERAGVVVLGPGPDGLRVATSDPTNVVALDDVKLYTGVQDLTLAVATDSQIRDLITRVWSMSRTPIDVVEDTDAGAATVDPAVELSEAASAPVVQLVNEVLADAARLGASDVHLEPQADELRIRYRIDGLLRDVTTAPKRLAPAVVSRLKIMATLDIAERRRPQDGRTRLLVEQRPLDARVATLPTVHGEKVVVRLLPGADDLPSLDSLGLSADQLAGLTSALDRPHGLVLITGPTGAGKTNTLYAALCHLRSPQRNLISLEDPVEMQLPGVNQVQVHERSGMTFARGLRSVLRQDPDIVLVGEIRDQETAELAVRASLTGHLVLSSLHTNDAVATVSRLVDMGVAPFLLASSLRLVAAQRLLRVPCPSCAEPYLPGDDVLLALDLTDGDLDGTTPLHGTGCSNCGESGYRGRTGVFELLAVTPELRRAIRDGGDEDALARLTAGPTLRDSALAAAAAGRTTYEEVLRVVDLE